MTDTKTFDVCIFCALDEEARAEVDVFMTHCNTQFREGFSKRTNHEYRHAGALERDVFNIMRNVLVMSGKWVPVPIFSAA